MKRLHYTQYWLINLPIEELVRFATPEEIEIVFGYWNWTEPRKLVIVDDAPAYIDPKVTAHYGKEKSVWRNMIRRCDNPEVFGYHHYGGRGITYCERWKKFENFLEDMGLAPPKYSLDRIDVNGNYEPSNCRWASWRTQMQNRRGWTQHRLPRLSSVRK